jgi:hypothetical protein
MGHDDRRYGLVTGDRIVIDSRDREPGKDGIYAVVSKGRIMLEPARDLASRKNDLGTFDGDIVLGRVTGRISGF